MHFSEVYRTVLALWPTEIRLSDGYPTGDDGYYFPTLSDERNRIEDLVGVEDPWPDLMVWTFFQLLHREAKRLVATQETIRPAEIPPALIEAQYFANLGAEDWRDLLPEYVRDPDDA